MSDGEFSPALIGEFQEAAFALLNRMSYDRRLERLFVGTESYSKLIHAFAHSHGVELGELATLEPADNILDVIAKQKGKVNP